MQTSSLKISLVSRHQEDTMDTTRTQTHIQAQTIFFSNDSFKTRPSTRRYYNGYNSKQTGRRQTCINGKCRQDNRGRVCDGIFKDVISSVNSSFSSCLLEKF